MRGIGVLVMMAYHAGSHSVPGAFFMVSMFFTMSGYLITSLLLDEHQRKGGISLKKFWERRIRRLMPAAMLTIVLAMVLQVLFEVGSGPKLRGDLLSALGYVANWRFALTDFDYSSLFQAESPIQPFWSLAIEEQFYLFFPLLFLGAVVLTKGRRPLLAGIFGVATVASFVSGWLTARAEGDNTGLAYYATYTRAAEILVGIVLAIVLATPRARKAVSSRLATRLTEPVAWIAVAVMAWLVITVELTDSRAFRGLILLNTIATGLLIVAALSTRPSVVNGFFSWTPVRNVGKICYGLYVYHWPVFLLLDEERVGVDGTALFLVRFAATFAVAIASYHLVECPIRFNRVRLLNTGWRLTGGMAAGFASVTAVVLLLPVHESEMVDLGSLDQFEPVIMHTDPAAGVTPVANILVVGDSVPYSMASGFDDWNENHPDQQINLDIYLAPACTLGEPAPMGFLGGIEEPNEACLKFRDLMPGVFEDSDYDVVMMVMGQKDVTQRELDGEWRHIGQPAFDQWFEGQVDQFGDLLVQEGAPVLWASASHVRMFKAGEPASTWQRYEDNAPERIDRLNEILDDRFGTREGFHKLDVAGWLAGLPLGEYSDEYRLDGAHYTRTGAEMLAEWAVPQAIALVEP